MHYFSNLFDVVLYMFRTCPLSIIRSISTLYTPIRYLPFKLFLRLLASSGPDRNTTRVTAFGPDTHPSCLHLTSIQQQLENQTADVVTNSIVVSS